MYYIVKENEELFCANLPIFRGKLQLTDERRTQRTSGHSDKSAGSFPFAIGKVCLEEGNVPITHTGKSDAQWSKFNAGIAHMFGQQIPLLDARNILEVSKARAQWGAPGRCLPALAQTKHRHTQHILRRCERSNPMVDDQEMVLIIMRQLIPSHLWPGYEVIRSRMMQKPSSFSSLSG